MKIIDVTYSFSAKINLGNYQSADVFLAAKAQVDDGEDPAAVYGQLKDWVKEKVREERREIIEKNRAGGGSAQAYGP